MAKVLSLPTPQPTTRPAQNIAPGGSSFTGSDFVGRDREMVTLRASLTDVVAGHGRLVLLVGEPGIGKTRTTQELTGLARRQGARVLTGRCYEGDGAPPFWPWVQIVREYLQECSLATIQTDLGTGAVDVAQVIPEVRERLPELPAAPTLEPEQARFRFFDSFTRFLKNAARVQPLVLVLDDLHWADASSLLLLQFLVREVENAPVLIIGTYRDVDLELHHPLRQALGEVARAAGSQTLQLHGLSESEVAEILNHLTGATPEEALLTAVYQQTEGNPFFLTEVARVLASEGSPAPLPTPPSAPALPVPQRVLDVISRRLTRLSGECLQVLTLASVIGRDFPLAVLTRASELSRVQLLQALEEAMRAQVVIADPQIPSNYSFSHALMRETLYRELTLTQRVTFHRQVGEALESVYRTNPTRPLTEIAYHFFVAAQGGEDIERALTYATQAGEQATALLAYEEAIKQYQNALQLFTLREPDEGGRCELLLALGSAYRKAGQSTQEKAMFLEAATSARQRGHSQQLARAALGFSGSWIPVGVVNKTAVTLLEEALQALGEQEDGLRASLYARLAMQLWFGTARERRLALSQQAVQLARSAGNQRTLGYCLQARHFSLWGSPQLAERLAITTEVLQLADQTRDGELAAYGYIRRISDLLAIGNLVALEEAIARHAQMAEQLRQPAHSWFTLIFQVMRRIMAGQFEDGERLAQQALTLGQQAHDQNAIAGFGIQMFVLRREQGRLLEMESALSGFIERYHALSAFQYALMYLYSEVGKEAEARARFEEFARQGFTNLPQDQTLPLSLAFLAHVCAGLGDIDRATHLYALLLPYADYNIVMSAANGYFEPASHPLGLLATLLGKWDEAERHFTHALAMTTRLGARPRLADAQYAYAKLLLTRQRLGDQEHAIRLLDAALATAQELGMAGLEAKIQRLQITKQQQEQSTPPAETVATSIAEPHSISPQSSIVSSHTVNLFRREGDYWTISYHAISFHLKHLRGLDYIVHLLRHPDVEFLALDLMTPAHDPAISTGASPRVAFGDPSVQGSPLDGAAPLLDSQAREAYKRRVADLREELAEAQAFNDVGQVEKLQEEMDFLAAELTHAVGLRGRTRTTPTAAERARVNVTKNIKTALSKIGEQSPLLEHYLTTNIKTGLFCSYAPPPVNPITWEF